MHLMLSSFGVWEMLTSVHVQARPHVHKHIRNTSSATHVPPFFRYANAVLAAELQDERVVTPGPSDQAFLVFLGLLSLRAGLSRNPQHPTGGGGGFDPPPRPHHGAGGWGVGLPSKLSCISGAPVFRSKFSSGVEGIFFLRDAVVGGEAVDLPHQAFPYRPVWGTYHWTVTERPHQNF